MALITRFRDALAGVTSAAGGGAPGGGGYGGWWLGLGRRGGRGRRTGGGEEEVAHKEGERRGIKPFGYFILDCNDYTPLVFIVSMRLDP